VTPHRLTLEAARNMIAFVERAARYRALEDDKGQRRRKSVHYLATARDNDEMAPTKAISVSETCVTVFFVPGAFRAR
jgi:hypothetical protein